MDLQHIIKDIQSGKLHNIYLLHGEEPYFIDAISETIEKYALAEHERDFDQVILYGRDTDTLSLISELKAFPMMATKKLVILKEAQDLKGFDDLDSYFEQPSATTIFVVNYKYKNLDARKKSIKTVHTTGLVFKSDKIKDYQLADWITKYMQSINLKITSKAAMLLVEFLGNDLSLIVNEIDKLKIVLPDETTINDQHIEDNIGISKDYNIYELTNALASKDFVKAFKIVDYFDHNPKAADLTVLIPTIFKFYAQLMRIHFLKTASREAIAGALKVHPFVAGELLSASKLYNPKKIAQNIDILSIYDLKHKGIGNTGAFGQGELLKELVYKLLH